MFLEFEITVNSGPAVSFASLSNFHSAPFAKRRACHVIIYLSFWRSEVASESTPGRFNM